MKCFQCFQPQKKAVRRSASAGLPPRSCGAPSAPDDSSERSPHSQEDRSPKVQAVRQEIEADPDLLTAAHAHRGGESLNALCARFAHASSSVSAAVTLLANDLRYRDTERILELSAMTPGAVLSGRRAGVVPSAQDRAHEAELRAIHDAMLPNGLLGHDRLGRPILYKHYGQVRIAGLTSRGIELANLIRYNTYLCERTAAAMQQRGKWVIIIDMSGIGLSQVIA